MFKKVIIFTDGGSRGNPGPSGIGVVILDSDTKEKIKEISKYIGTGTNNQAEYEAIWTGLSEAKKLGAEEVQCFLDSELVVKQLKGLYRVKNENIINWFLKVKGLLPVFNKVVFSHIPRENNKDADKLVNEALDKELKK